MDTIQLDELLECSVCLEQLDETCKVLPCQHTFCRRCLKEIVERRKELRCPECRILVDANIDDLPSNIFLVRLLEGLKKNRKPLDKLCTEHQESSSDQGDACAKALYDYEPQEAGDLPLHKGEIITLLRQVDENWYEGHAGDLRGFLPANYIEVIQPLPSLDVCDMPIAKALYDFEDEQEHDLLTFKSGDMIQVVRRVDENWCEGKLNTKLGIFPITFVELNTAARNLIEGNDVNTSEFAMGPGGNVSKPLRKSENKDIGEPKRHTMHFVGQRVEETHSIDLQRHSLDISSTERLAEAFGSTSGNSASSTGRQETTPSSSSTRSSSLDQAQSSPPRSGGSAVESRTSGGSRPASAEIGKEMYVALYSYKPIKDDELELLRGESYYVTEKCKDGWFKGFHVWSQKRGVFPGNYVRLASIHNLLTSSRSSSPDYELPSSLSSPNSNPQQQQQQHQQRPPPRRTSSEGGSHTRYHRSDSAPPYAPRAALALESLVVNLDQGGGGIENRTAGERPAGWNVLAPASPPPPTPGPKSGSFFKKLKGKKKDKTRMAPPPPPPPPYQRYVPAGHSTLSPSLYPTPPLYVVGALSSTSQGTRRDSPSTKLHHRVENPPVRERYRVTVAYPPQNEAELELRVGDVVYVTKKRQDGWYKGTLERNGKTGLFPGSFVGIF